MLVSIGVAIYNVDTYIKRCCHHLFNQTYKNIEFIFVDDASPDNSIELLKAEIAKRPDIKNNVRIITHEHNRGLSAARNTIIQNCKGDFIFWVDPDDYIELNCIELLVNQQKKKDFDIVSCDIICHYKNATKIRKQPDIENNQNFTKALISRNVPIFLCARLIRVELYTKNQISAKEGINYAEDFQVIPRLAFHATRISAVHEPLYHYDCSNNTSYTFNFSIQKAREEWESFKIIHSYFLKFSPEYDDAIKYGIVYKICKDLIGATKIEDQSYFNEMHHMLNSIEKKYWKFIPFPRRLILYTSKISSAKILLYIKNLLKK